jgi:hypothetical protein
VHRAVLPTVMSLHHSLVCVCIHSVWCIFCALPDIRVTVEAPMLRSFVNRVIQPLEVVGACVGPYLWRYDHVDSGHSTRPRPVIRMAGLSFGCRHVLS